MPKQKRYSAKKAVREMARERVGSPPAPKVIIPKNLRKKPKHKKALDADLG